MARRCGDEKDVPPPRPPRHVSAPQPAPTLDTFAGLNLLALALTWGFAFLFIEVALTGIKPFMLVQLRVLIAALALWPFVLATGTGGAARRAHLGGAVRALGSSTTSSPIRC